MQDGVMQVYRVHKRLTVTVGDITLETVDAIVNAANAQLLGGGGVDGAIHAAGGPEILRHCEEIRATEYPAGLPTGQAVITPGGNLATPWVIHTVGPVYGSHAGTEAKLLAACYENSIALAAEHGLQSIAFPAISTGVYGYPKPAAAKVARAAIDRALAAHPKIKEVRLVFFSRDDADIFMTAT